MDNVNSSSATNMLNTSILNKDIIMKKFRCGTLFDIHPTKAYKMSNKDLFKEVGKTPVLSNSSMNNGIGGYSNLEPTEKGGIITFSDTTTGPDTLFYQPNDFIGYPHVQGMYPYNEEGWNEYTLMYFICALKRASGSSWNYSNKFNRKIVAEIQPVLPIKTDENNKPIIDEHCTYSEEGYMPDFEYMEKMMIELEDENILALDNYLINIGLNDCVITEEDKRTLKMLRSHKSDTDSVQLIDFEVSELFKTQTIKCKLSQQDLSDDYKYPAYSSNTENNGIIGYTQTPEFICDDECPVYVTFGDHTRTLNIVRESFGVLDNVKVLIPCVDDDEALLFMITQWQKQIPNLGYARHWKIAKDCRLSLPIKLDLDKKPIINTMCKYHKEGYIPDWDFMAKYIKVIEKIVIADVVQYKDNFIKEKRA